MITLPSGSFQYEPSFLSVGASYKDSIPEITAGQGVAWVARVLCRGMSSIFRNNCVVNLDVGVQRGPS